MPAVAGAPTLALASADLERLRVRVRALAENRPGVYRMLSATGRILYIGKARKIRTRLLSYFRADNHDKAARILQAAHDIKWDYAPSEFAALLGELRLIRQHRPPYNVQMNRTRRELLIKISGGAAPRVYGGSAVAVGDRLAYGPFNSMGRMLDAVRVLNDLLGLRDCAATMPIVYASQGDLFDAPRHAACMRHQFGTCTGPCAGFVSEADYRSRADVAAAFLEGRTLTPLDRAVHAMTEAAAANDFERAARWRDKFEQLEWLLAATSRARTAIDLLTFVYRDPGTFGDDRAYVVRRGVVRATYPWPGTPIEQAAFAGVVAREQEQLAGPAWPLPLEFLDEILLVSAWFRRHPEALRRTTPLGEFDANCH
ncbi:MAG: nuclease [Gemmatimonadetes bacterium]|nr:nuclease [Gemmatimonadota bacterium]